MIRLLQPLGLLALASLLLPIAIHLMRRADRRVLEFAALRFLNERRHPRREWQLRERTLLTLRLSMLAAASVLLAIPVWRGVQDTRAHWLAVAPASTSPAAARHPLAPATTVATLASQIRELDAQLPLDTQLEVMVPEELGGLDAERLHLAHAVRWQIVPGRSPATLPPPQVSQAPQAPLAPQVPSASATAAPLAIAVHADAASAELPVARALVSAWTAASQTAEQARWLLWLGGPLSRDAADWVKRGGRVLVTQDPSRLGATVLSDDDGTIMFRERPLGRGRVLSTTAPLTLATMPGLRNPAVADRLQSLMAAPLTAPDRARASDVTPRHVDSSVTATSAGLNITEYVAALAAILYFAERLWATRASRAGIR